MRLRNIYVLCNQNIENVKAIKGNASSNNNSYTVVTGWGVFLESYNILNEIDFLKQHVLNLMNSVPEIYRHQKQFTVTTAEWNKINRYKNMLVSSIENVIELYESMELSSEETLGLDIKLPKFEDFSEFKKCIDELDFILYKCPLFKAKGEDLKFNTMDVGSMWLNFLIIGVTVGATSIILNNIAAFLDKCIVVRSHKITVDQQALQLQSMALKEEKKRELLEGINDIYQAQVETIISELENETGVNLKDGEERGIVAQSFEKANILIDKGLQIYSTIDSPAEIKALFEPIEMKYLSIGDEIKMLEKKGTEKNSEV